MNTPAQNEHMGERLWHAERKGFFQWLKQRGYEFKFPTDIFTALGDGKAVSLIAEFEAQ